MKRMTQVGLLTFTAARYYEMSELCRERAQHGTADTLDQARAALVGRIIDVADVPLHLMDRKAGV